MAINANSVFAIAPELSKEDPARVATFITYAQQRCSGNFLGNRYELAVNYLTAHLLTMSNRQGTGGAVKSYKEGDISYTYDFPQDANDLDATAYGQQYRALLRGTVRMPPLV